MPPTEGCSRCSGSLPPGSTIQHSTECRALVKKFREDYYHLDPGTLVLIEPHPNISPLRRSEDERRLGCFDEVVLRQVLSVSREEGVVLILVALNHILVALNHILILILNF